MINLFALIQQYTAQLSLRDIILALMTAFATTLAIA
jgi:hypothetical protein